MATFKQEMPPSGGYSPFEYAKKQRPRWLKGKYMFAGYVLFSAAAIKYHTWHFKRNIINKRLENIDANIAIEPILKAERDRMFLKQLIENRETEAEIMKDVPGWIPGTYYGSPVYHNKTLWTDPAPEEYWAHADYWKGYYNQQLERHEH